MARYKKNIFAVSSIAFALLFCGPALFCGPTKAQEVKAQEINIRTGRHDGYSRIVFEWTTDSSYRLERQARRDLAISFDNAAKIDLPALLSDLPANILEVEQLNSTKDTLSLKFEIPGESRVRDFKIGNRMIVDIYDPPGGPVKPQTQSIKKASKDTAKLAKKTVKKSEKTPAPVPERKKKCKSK